MLIPDYAARDMSARGFDCSAARRRRDIDTIAAAVIGPIKYGKEVLYLYIDVMPSEADLVCDTAAPPEERINTVDDRYRVVLRWNKGIIVNDNMSKFLLGRWSPACGMTHTHLHLWTNR